MAKIKETEAHQMAEIKMKKATAYKVIGERTKSKEEANNAVKEAHKKGFKNAGLMVLGKEFIALYGTYETITIAKESAAAAGKAGLKAEILDVTERL